MKYKFTWKKRWVWRTELVTGHRYQKEFDKMTLYYPNGALSEIPEWSKCYVRLGEDWVLAVKTQMEKEAGQKITLAENK